MDTFKRLIASAVVVVPLSIAFAETPAASDPASAAAVETLKTSLGGKGAIEVENIRMTDSGVACIQYRGPNNSGGISNGYAVVQGEKVLKSSVGNKRFENAWKEHCAGGSSKAAE